MNSLSNNIRKAAILIRSLDVDTAAGLLAQLTPAEASEVRAAIKALGAIDEDERADVSAEFRRIGPVAAEDPHHGVELELSSYSTVTSQSPVIARTRHATRPFEFLEQARVESLVPYLAREHGQTVAVVLSYLPPARAAQVLAALPTKLQAEAIDRLSVLGDTDPDSLQVLERELADWVARQQATRTRPTQRTGTVEAIIAAADQEARREILGNLIKQNHPLAEQFTHKLPEKRVPFAATPEPVAPVRPLQVPIPPAPVMPRLPQLHIDDVARLDKQALTAVLKTVDAEVLVLALVGASDRLVDRITAEMPGKVAKAFRNRLGCVGPTRLRDVEAAQHEVTTVAARIMHARRAVQHAVLA